MMELEVWCKAALGNGLRKRRLVTLTFLHFMSS
jgi:hypothetical protein